MWPGAGGPRSRRAGGPDPGRRQRGLAAGYRTQVLAELEQFDVELVEQPVGRSRKRPSFQARPRSPSPATRASASEEAERRVELDAFRVTGIKLSKVGGTLPRYEISEVLLLLCSSALDGPVGIAAGGAGWRGHPAPCRGSRRAEVRPRPRHPAALRLDDRLGRVRAGRRHAAPARGPGLGVEIDEDALRAHRL